MYVATNVLCCKCYITRRGKWAQTEVVPLGVVVPACTQERSGSGGPHMHVQAHAYRTSRQGRAGRRGDNSTRTHGDNNDNNSVPVGGQELHACAVGRVQVKREARHGARVPSVGCMHLGKCVACRGSAPGAWARTSGR
jgi:hypothetical protein